MFLCCILSCTNVAEPVEGNVAVVFLHEVICRCHCKVDFLRVYSMEKYTSF